MQLSIRPSLLLAYIVVAAATPVFKIQMQPVASRNSLPDGRTVNVIGPLSPELQRAQEGVQRQLGKITTTLNLTESGDADAIRRVRLAYGQHGIDNIAAIRQNVANIDGGAEDRTMRISPMSAQEVDRIMKEPTNAVTMFDPEKRPSDATPLTSTGPVYLGSTFNKAKDANAPSSDLDLHNTATILHEAGHLFNEASDHYVTKLGKSRGDAKKITQMLPLGVSLTQAEKDAGKEMVKGGGYANTDTVIARPGERITDAQLSPEFKALRDSPDTKDILKNADSLALLGQACDAEMRRVRKRALMEGDHVTYFLAKRWDCAKRQALKPLIFKEAAAKGKAMAEARAAKAAAAAAANDPASIAKDKAAPKTIEKSMKTARLATSKPSKAVSETAKGKTSKAKTSKTLLRSPKAKTLKAKSPKSVSKASKAKTLRVKTARPTSKVSKTKFSKARSPKSASKNSKSARAKAGSSKAVSKKGAKSKVSSASRSSPKKSVTGATKKGGAKQTKKASTRSPASRGKQTPKAKSTKATTATRKAIGTRPKVVVPTKAPTQRAAAPKKAAKAVPEAVIAPVKAAVVPKRGGK